MNGKNVYLPVDTDPAGASIKVKGREYTTPAVLEIPRGGKSVVIAIEKEGYKTEKVRLDSVFSGWFYANFALFPIGFAIAPLDLKGGYAFKFTPERISLRLTPVDNLSKLTKPKQGQGPIFVDISTHLSTENWYPFTESEMLSAIKDKAIVALSQSGRFHFGLESNAKYKHENYSLGHLRFDLLLLEKIELAKVTASLELPNGTTYVVTESESLSGKDYQEIFRVFEKLGNLLAQRLLNSLTRK